MLIDPSLNSVATVLANVYQSFYEAAVRCLEYARVLLRVRKMGSGLLISKSIYFFFLSVTPENSTAPQTGMQSGSRGSCAELEKASQKKWVGDRHCWADLR